MFASDGQVAYEFGRPLIRAGRLPHLDAPDEALVSSAAARAMGLEVGDEIAARLPGFGGLEALGTAGGDAAGGGPEHRPPPRGAHGPHGGGLCVS